MANLPSFTTTVTDATGATAFTHTTALQIADYHNLLAAYRAIYISSPNADGTPGTPYTDAQILAQIVGGIYQGILVNVTSYLKQQAAVAAASAVAPIVAANQS